MMTNKEILQAVKDGRISKAEALARLNALRAPAVEKPAAAAPAASQARGAIAIVGIAGQFPEADDVHALWQNLIDNRVCVGEVPSSRLDQAANFNPAGEKGKSYCKWGGILEGRDCFDPLFFNISPREAVSMSPSQRLFLTEAWSALEDAGYAPDAMAGQRCGVYVGAEPCGYQYETFTGSSDALIASRLSYLLNLEGPSLVVNTSCSSSATAIHLACEALRSFDQSIAIAGGVFAALRDDIFIAMSDSGIMSPTGACRAFDDAADGTIMSEAVGVLILKRLEDALRDGNHIHGVIKASGYNQDGKSNGISAPNGLAQQALIERVYRDYGIDPRAISYVEAHGTGTKLGDPVEANALIAAFRSFTDERQFCAIGSVKANIGHATAAAGVVGVIKILLALRHGTLPPMANYSTPNSLIDIDASPFFVGAHAAEWRAAPGQPRMAALNSFGHSGTNVHIVIEQHLAAPAPQVQPGGGRLVPLSAKSPEQLTEYGQRLAAFLARQPDQDGADGEALLEELAYTLQTGRKHLEHRLVFVADTLAALRTQVAAYLRDPGGAGGWHSGRIDKTRARVRVAAAELALQGQFAQIAQRHCDGETVDWAVLYPGARPRLRSVPTYPFTRKRYTRPPAAGNSQSRAETPARLHRLVHANVSTLGSHAYAASFDPSDVLLAEHQVKGQGVLPGVAYLEMARAAGSLAGLDQVRVVEDVFWLRPMSGDDARMVRISLTDGADAVQCQVSSGAEARLNFRARLPKQPALTISTAPARINLDDVRRRCTAPIDMARQYAEFDAAGLAYGAAFRRLATLHHGALEAWGELAVDGLDWPHADGIHPGLLDAALHSVAGLSQGRAPGGDVLYLPFSLARYVWYRTLPATAYVVARPHGEGPDTSTDSASYDIDIVDEDGQTCVSFQRFTVRALGRRPYGAADAGVVSLHDCVMARPQWLPAPMPAGAPQHAAKLTVYADAALAGDLSVVAWQPLPTAGDQSAPAVHPNSDHALACHAMLFGAVQAILKRFPKDVHHLVVFLPGSAEQPLFRQIAALLGTARHENAHLRAKVVALGCDGQQQNGQQHIGAELDEASFDATAVAYIDGLRQTERLTSFAPPPGQLSLRDGAVIWITGGLGGLGAHFTGLLERRGNVRIVLSGRREAGLAPASAHTYIQCDVADGAAVARTVDEIRRRFGRLDGVIHSAGVVREHLIIRTDADDSAAVLLPKIAGSTAIDRALGAAPLDFFVLCSSMSAVRGSPGLADYASANAFMDGFARWRQERVLQGACAGRTLSVNWPLWAAGGMRMGEREMALITQQSGIAPLATATGLALFEAALASPFAQVVVAQGDVARMRAALSLETAAAPASAGAIIMPCREVAAILRQEVAELLSMAAGEIDLDVDLGEYGFDSISLTELAERVNRRFEAGLQPSDLYEYNTLAALAAHLETRAYAPIVPIRPMAAAAPVETAPSVLQALTDIAAQLLSTAPSDLDPGANLSEYGFDSISFGEFADTINKRWGVTVEPTQFFDTQSLNALAAWLQSRHGQAMPVPAPVAASVAGPPAAPAPLKHEPEQAVAIIGISGRFPHADSPAQLWDNLVNARHCIDEVPAERWDWRAAGGGAGTRWGGFMRDIDKFDALFFGISPKEAALMDPQQRLLFEHVWLAMEDAGYSAAALAGSATGMFIATTGTGYAHLIERSALPVEGFGSAGIVPSGGPNRMSYLLNLHGPSEPVETACSSSLVAIHRALRAIRAGECTAAFAGGVNTIVTPHGHLGFSKAGMLSADGRCKSFAAAADGYVRGEGAAVLLLKRLDLAIADGDHVWGVLRGSAVNHGGRASSLTAPNPSAQAEVIKAALRDAGVDARTIGYVETHGTGTALGDPIEINGLKKAFGEPDGPAPLNEPARCALGALKSNIGHLELAAGIAGVVKVLLAMRHRSLPPSLHLDAVNPYIDLAGSPFRFLPKREEWAPLHDAAGGKLPRRAGVSSFGYGGVNAHVVLEEWVDAPPDDGTRFAQHPARQLVPLSAKTMTALRERVRRLLDYLAPGAGQAALDLAPVAFTLQAGRDAFDYRVLFVATTLDQLMERMAAWLRGDHPAGVIGGQDLPVRPRGEEKAALAQRMAALWSGGEIEQAGALWVQGGAPDWISWWGECHPRRTPLPGYPFARTRHWVETAPQPGPAPVAAPTLRTKEAADFFRSFLAQQLKLPEDAIKDEMPLDGFGVDSIMAIDLAAQLATLFGELPKTLFFECRTLADLTRYFSERHGETLARLCGAPPAAEVAAAVSAPVASPMAAPVPVSARALEHGGIAVIGIGGRYPKADGIAQFWANLTAGVDCISDIPAERWDHAQHYSPDKLELGKTACRKGGFIGDIDKFDPAFFNMTPIEAQIRDPQEKLMLQAAWHALEDAGYTRQFFQEHGLNDAVGVYLASMYQQFSDLLCDNPLAHAASMLWSYSSMANRVSQVFDFRGPSIAVDSMCSGALSALHMACDSLRSGALDYALVGGVNLSLHPRKLVGLSMGQLVGSTERSMPLGQGDGYLPSEGVGVVVLKRVADALADGDNIYGVIKATGINHAGRTKGFSVPDPQAQFKLIQDNFARAGITPHDVSYVECAANGSEIGDAIELNVLARVFAGAGPCALGSVKSNLGHGEAVSGMAQLTKVLLQLKHKTLAPTLHDGRVNTNIDLDASPFRLQDALAPWHASGPRIATVSAIGAGGSNAHVIVEEAPPAAATGSEVLEGPAVLVLSARTGERLQARAADLLRFMRDESVDIALSDILYTLQVGREAMRERLALVVRSRQDAIDGLARFLDPEASQDVLVPDSAAPNDPQALAAAWVAGVPVDWHVAGMAGVGGMGGVGGIKGRRVSLPVYPFERQLSWPLTAPPSFASEVSVAKAEAATAPGLLQLIQEILGLSPEGLDQTRTLIEAGADSVALMRLRGRISQRFGVETDLADLAGNSIAALVRMIGSEPQAGTCDCTQACACAQAGKAGFIGQHAIVIPAGDADGTQRGMQGEAILAALIGAGVGCWRQDASVQFEFANRRHSPDTVDAIAAGGAALSTVLVEGERYYPVSPMQQLMLAGECPERRARFNVADGCTLPQEISRTALALALQQTVDQHPILRTGYRKLGTLWMQVVRASAQATVHEVVLDDADDDAAFLAKLNSFIAYSNATRFDLEQVPLMKAYWVHNRAGRSLLWVQLHHIDGFSIAMLLNEVLERYRAALAGEAWVRMPPAHVGPHFGHFALDQHGHQDAAQQSQVEEFAARLAPQLAARRPLTPEPGAARQKLRQIALAVPPALWESLAGFQARGVTLTQVLSCAFALALRPLQGPQVVLNMALDVRQRWEFERVIGDFSAALPLALQLDEGGGFDDLLRQYAREMAALRAFPPAQVMALRHALAARLGMDAHDPRLFGNFVVDSIDRNSLAAHCPLLGEMLPYDQLPGLSSGREPIADGFLLMIRAGQSAHLLFMYDSGVLSERTATTLCDAVLATLAQAAVQDGLPEVEQPGALLVGAGAETDKVVDVSKM